MQQMQVWQPYFIAIAIGLLIGIEREKSQSSDKTMGVRTFLLVSLSGAVAAGLQNTWLTILISAFTLGLILISYYTQTNSKATEIDRGLTTEFAAGIVYCLGYAAHNSPTLTAVIAPVVAVILFSKPTLHRFTHAIKPTEFQAALLLLLAGVVVINLVPDTVIDPWGVFNPQKFGFIVLILATFEFASYLGTKIIGEKNGSLVIGFLGGFVSSTAVLLSSARNSVRAPATWPIHLCTTLSAQIAAFVELLIIIGLISTEIFFRIAIPISAAIFVGLCAIYILIKENKLLTSELVLKSPLDWRGVLRLSILLALILGTISLVKHWLGDQATLVVSFLTALFELHGVSLANATMYSHGQLSDKMTIQNIFFAVIASLIAKVVISGLITKRSRFFSTLLLVTLPMIGLIVLGLWSNN